MFIYCWVITSIDSRVITKRHKKAQNRSVRLYVCSTSFTWSGTDWNS